MSQATARTPWSRGNTVGTTKGFTLVELMVAMVVAAILLAVAIPSYTTYVLKSHRTEAKAALLDLASMEERYFSTQNAYTNVPTAVGFSQATWGTPIVVGSGYYQLSTPVITAPTISTAGGVLTATPASFSLQAVVVPGNMQAKDTVCSTFTVTSTGSRTSTDSGGNDSTATCWN
jgi:type IV pilus assembly protein PilE